MAKYFKDPDLLKRLSEYGNSLFNPVKSNVTQYEIPRNTNILPLELGIEHWRNDSYAKKPVSLLQPKQKEDIFTKTKNNINSLFNPIPNPSQIKYDINQGSGIIGKVPLSMDPSKVTGVTDSTDDNGRTPSENDLINNLVASSEKSIKEQKNYNLFKTISDAIQTGGAMIGNATAQRPEPIRPPVVIPPTYQSNLEENKNLIDRNMAGSLAAGIKMARETGRPELIPSLIANLQSGENTAYNQLAQNEIQQNNLQEVANTEAINKNAELGYGAKIQDAEMMDKINATRSELLAKMGNRLFSTIPDSYVENKASLVDQGDKIKAYKWYLDQGNNISFDDFAVMMGWMERKTTTKKDNSEVQTQE